MIKTEVQKARAACEGNSSAALLMIYINQLDNMKSGGVVIDGRRFNYGNLAELAEATDFKPSATEKLMKLLCDRNLAERRMHMVKIGGTWTRKLCFRLTSRGTSFMKGGGQKIVGSEPEDFPVETAEFSGSDQKNFGSPLYVTSTSPETQPNLTYGGLPPEPPTSSSAENFSSNSKGAEESVKKEKIFPKSVMELQNSGKKSEHDLLHKPDKVSKVAFLWKSLLGEWLAERNLPSFTGAITGKEVGILKNLWGYTTERDLEIGEVLAFALKHWIVLAKQHNTEHAGQAKASLSPDVISLWTMRATTCNQLHSSKAPKKQEAVVAKTPDLQSTATTAPPPTPKPAKQKTSPAKLKELAEKYGL